MIVWIASFNSNKIKELSMLAQTIKPNLELKIASDIIGYSAPAETGSHFIDNARIKARSLAAVKPHCWVIAEDSGLVLPGLGGLPGVHSARYAGEKASDSENIAKLLKMLQIRRISDRSAYFHCSLIAFDPEGKEHSFTGQLNGHISDRPAGQLGFGYDPIFIPEGQTQTLAELGAAYKNSFSHRALAFKQWLSTIEG